MIFHLIMRPGRHLQLANLDQYHLYTSNVAKLAEGRVSKLGVESSQGQTDGRQYGNQKGFSTAHCLIDAESWNLRNLLPSVLEYRQIYGSVYVFSVTDHNVTAANLLSRSVSPSIVQ